MNTRSALVTWALVPAFASVGMTATPTLSLRPIPPDRVELSWPADAAGFALEQAESLAVATPWSAVSIAPSTVEGRLSVTLTPASQTRYFRLTGNPPVVTRIVETSPAAGETGVSVTRETILRFSGPLAASTLLMGEDLHAEFGGRRWLTRTELSSDRRSATLFFLENLPASSRMRVVVSGDRLLDAAGVALDADGDGQPGGVRILEFDTGGVSGVPATAMIGRVFAAEKNPDGSNRPLPNTTITVNGAEETLRTTTDASGRFKLEPVPAGRFFVHVDGRTAQGSHWPGGAYYPYVGKAWEAVAGKTNNLAGGTGEIFLPLIQNDALKAVSPTAETRVTFTPAVLAANPALAGVEIVVPPNALFADNGTRGGMVGIAPVPADRLPEPLPAGLTLPLVITIQTDGAANFDQPVPVKFPNLPDPRTGRTAGPGETTVLWSFNHDSGHWEPQGTMTVSADGKFAVSDPGVGVRQPGWHGSSPGGPAGGPGGPPPGPGCPPYCGPRPDPPCDEPDPCGPARYAYQEKYDEWRDAVRLGGLLSGKAVNLGKEVDALHRAYSECREAQGWPCEGPAPAPPASRPPFRSAHAWARTSAGSEAEIRWNDAIRTGIEDQNHASVHSALPGPGAWFALESLETGFIQRGQLNSAAAVDNVFVAPGELYQLSYYDAVNRRSGSVTLRSQPSGNTTYLPYALLLRAEGGAQPDSDGDGLSDFAEFIVATAPNKADSDSDGIPDGRELSLGSNPLDGVGLPLGIVAQVATPGQAELVIAENDLALVVARNGLAVFDVSDPRKPTQVSVVPGAAKAAALRGRLALAAFSDRVVLLDLSAPASPQVRWSRNVERVEAVAFGSGDSVFVSGSLNLQRWDLGTGETTGAADDGGRGESLLVRGEQVYVLSGAGLRWFVDGDVLTPGGSLQVPGSGGAGGRPRQIAAIGSRLYTQHTSGFNVVDVAEPATPRLLATVNTTSQGWRQIAPIRPDLALVAVGPNSTSDGPHDVALYSFGSGGTNAVFLTTLTTPGAAYSVAVAGGRGYVADGMFGLAVVNGLAPDASGVPPTVALELENPASPPRVQAGTTVRLGALAEDDVAVRFVEFWINGARVTRDDSLPFEHFHSVPPVGAAPGQFSVQLRAEDMAGNVGVSPETTILVVPDATPPRIVRLMPPPGSEIVPGVVTEVSMEFDEAVSNPALAQGMSVFSDGPDGILDTADDVVVPGSAQFDATRQRLVWTTPSGLAASDHRATLPAGISDVAGNIRPLPLSWRFDTGPEPYVAELFPPRNYVQVGGTLDALRLTFNQPVPDVSVATYVLAVGYRQEPGQGAFVPVAPLNIERDRESRTFTLRTSGTFPPGEYRITGSGPNVQAMLWEFLFRNVGNEAVDVPFGEEVAWKYFPGPGIEDELVVNVPGKVGLVNMQGVRSLTAYSDVRFLRQVVEVPEPIQCFAGLIVSNVRFGPGVTHVRGPLQIFDVFGNEFTTLGAHTLHAYGGGFLRAEIRFGHPDGALVNHPGSVFEIQGGMIANTGASQENWGRLVNRGTLRNTGELGRLEDIRVRNEGRIEVAIGQLVLNDLEQEGALDLAADTLLVLRNRFRAGASSSLTGAGAVEMGVYDSIRRRIVSAADAEFQGEVALTGPMTLVAGKATLWRSLIHPDQTFAAHNGSLLEFLAPSEFGTLDLRGGTVRFQSDGRFRLLLSDGDGILEPRETVSILGDNQIVGLTVLGTGLVDFMGGTLVSNRTAQVGIRVGHGSIRNSGVWTHAVNNNNGSELLVRRVEGEYGRGTFENTGIFTQTVAKPLVISVPFLNSGLAEFGEGPLIFDGRTNNGGFGAYRPQPGGELVLNATQIQNQNGGALDLVAGSLRGTGTIRCNSNGDGPQVINRAVLQPGNPLGTLTIRSAGAFEQTATGELVATLAPSDSSRLVLQSTRAILAGRLRVILSAGFSPEVGQSFDVLTFSGRTGEFSEVLLPALGAGKKLEVAYSSSAVTVRVVAN